MFVHSLAGLFAAGSDDERAVKDAFAAEYSVRGYFGCVTPSTTPESTQADGTFVPVMNRQLGSVLSMLTRVCVRSKACRWLAVPPGAVLFVYAFVSMPFGENMPLLRYANYLCRIFKLLACLQRSTSHIKCSRARLGAASCCNLKHAGLQACRLSQLLHCQCYPIHHKASPVDIL